MKKLIRLGMLASMNRHLPSLAALAVSLLLAACGTMRSSVVVEPPAGGSRGYSEAGSAVVLPARTAIPGGSYEVVKGDTLYSIAFRKGVDFRDLAQWNAIAVPYTIWPGQRLKLSPSAPTAANVTHVVSPEPTPIPATAVATPQHPVPARAVPPAGPVFEPVTAPAAASSNTKATTASFSPSKPAMPAAAATTTVPVAGLPLPPRATVPPPVPASAIAPGASHAAGGVAWRWPAQGSLIKRFQSSDATPGIEIAGNSGDAVHAAADGVVVYSGNGLVGYGELVIIKHNDSFLSAYGHNSKRLVKEGQRVTAGQQIAEMGSTGASRNELEFQIRKDGNPVDPLGYLPPH